MRQSFNYIIFCCLFIAVIFVPTLQSTVYVVGDSHAAFCFGATRDLLSEERMIYNYGSLRLPFAIYWLGPITMHRVGREGLSFLDIRRFGVKEGDVIIFVFGEIDVRCHIGKQRDCEERSLDEIINSLAENYIATIIANKKFYARVIAVVFNVIPPFPGTYNAEYPFYGTLEDRVSITYKLNATLAKLCKLHNILFLNIYDEYCNSAGDLNQALSDGGLHIGKPHNRLIKDKLLESVL
jgi:hypothetical protein